MSLEEQKIQVDRVLYSALGMVMEESTHILVGPRGQSRIQKQMPQEEPFQFNTRNLSLKEIQGGGDQDGRVKGQEAQH